MKLLAEALVATREPWHFIFWKAVEPVARRNTLDIHLNAWECGCKALPTCVALAAPEWATG